MKIEKKITPEEMKKTMGGATTKEEPVSKTLKSLKSLEELNSRGNVKAVFFINLTYLIGLIFLTIITLQDANVFAVSSIAVTTVGALIFNIVTFNEARRTKKHKEIIKTLMVLDNEA